MASSAYQDHKFRQQVDHAMQSVKRILANTRAPELPSEVAHTYDDKYRLAESLTNTTAAALVNALDALGLPAASIEEMRRWAADGHDVSIRFLSTQKCAFDREESREEKHPTTVQATTTSKKGKEKSKTTTVTTTITEYFWQYHVQYSVVAFKGAAPVASSITAVDRAGHREIMTKVKTAPRHLQWLAGNAGSVTPAQSKDQTCSVTWLLQLLSDDLKLAFKIDRTAESCRTPRRNAQMQSAIDGASAIAGWATRVGQSMERWQQVFGAEQHRGNYDAFCKAAFPERNGGFNATGLFIPIVPLFEAPAASAELPPAPPAYAAAADAAPPAAATAAVDIEALHSGESGALLSLGDVNSFLGEQRRSLAAKKLQLAELELEAGGLATADDAMFRAVLDHITDLAQMLFSSVGNIEHMLKEQLFAAIGRDINPQSFYQFMKHHQGKLYTAEAEPKPFSYAIRRPNCFPEGSISIEVPKNGDTPAEPVSTIVRHIDAGAEMSIRLNAQCTISLKGDQFLHAYLAQSFQGSGSSQLSLVARARQFSAFILMLGKIGSATSFQPEHAIIIKNKDDLKIPLMLEALPSAKEFKDAIESLSPEQQAFAKAYRSMQLEGTVFAVAVIQLKPQLERLLNLPSGSLTKEIKLSQQLQELFIEHQIPSDLLTYDGDDDAPRTAKLDAVRAHVAAILEMIAEAKDAEIQEQRAQSQYEHPVTAHGEICDEDDDDGEAFGMSSRSGHQMRSFASKGGGGGRPPPQMQARSARSFGGQRAEMACAMPEPVACMINDMIADEPLCGMSAAPRPPKLVSKEKSVPAQTPQTVDEGAAEASGESTALDFTQIPAALDKRFLSLDQDGALRATKIKVGSGWILDAKKALLAKPTTEQMDEAAKRSAKDKAFDLLDAISRSGTLAIEDCASLHVIVAVTHLFQKSLVDTVVQSNVNPIEKVERSSLIIAGAIHDRPIEQLVRPGQLDRIAAHSRQLMAPQTEA